MVNLVAYLFVTASLSGFGSRHHSKIKNWRHKQRSGQNTVAGKKYPKRGRGGEFTVVQFIAVDLGSVKYVILVFML